ncbi:unnamed protein product [Hymenolepis diminuta]|uniref:Protein kinase domain-containing protein n=1 Tax=Hymenolepis diminuta TaxID=6216 RepID=A0A0R3SSJ4_HYMDI|nr:unnamed protein product [Hymenolepis diminuta]
MEKIDRIIVPTITETSYPGGSSPPEMLEQFSALLADTFAQIGNFSSEYMAVPFASARLVFCYNLPEVSKYFQLVLSSSDIKAIFAGKINSWDDVRIRHKNPDFPIVQQPISLIVRDDHCRSNFALSKVLSNYSSVWRRKHESITSLRDFNATDDMTLYRALSSSGEFNLLSSIPYSMAYFLATIPPFPTISFQLSNGNVMNPADYSFEDGNSNQYPFSFNLYAVIKKDLDVEPYNISLRRKDPLQRFSSPCRLQVELYRFLEWLKGSPCAKEILALFGLRQINGILPSSNLSEMTCLNKNDLVVSAVQLYSEEMHFETEEWDDDDDADKEYRDIIFTSCATIVILLVVFIILFRYFRSHNHKFSEYLIDIRQMDSPDRSTTLENSPDIYKIKNTAFLEYALGTNKERNGGNPHAISKNIKKGATNAWVYADAILSTAPVNRVFKNVDVLLKPTNIPSTMGFSEKRMVTLQEYTEVDHENVVRFYGMAKCSAENCRHKRNRLANQLKKLRKTPCGGGLKTQGYSESDFVLPWIYYMIVEPCIRGSLFELLHSGQYEISQPMKLTLASDIASGMTYLHSRNIIHGNLSSLTCLLDSRWVIKISRWQHVKELIQTEGIGCKCILKNTSQRHLKVCWHPEYLRLVWKSPAQLKNFIATHGCTTLSTDHHADQIRMMEHIFSKKDHTDGRKSRTPDNTEIGVEETYGIEYKSMVCDVYSFGVILTEIWNLEVPFHAALTAFEHEYQLAEAICNKIRDIAESCIDHSELKRPSFRDVLKTMASLVPKGRSVAHHMLRAAIARLNDLYSTAVLRERGIILVKSELCSKLDQLFSPTYSMKVINGGVITPQNTLLAVVTLDTSFLQSATDGNENSVLYEIQCLKQISQKHANDQKLRCLAAPGGYENDGVCFAAIDCGEGSEPGSEEDRELILRLIRVVSQVECEFNAINKFDPLSNPKFCAVVHRSMAMSGPLGVYFPWQYVYGKALEEILELKRFAKPMEVLVSSEVTSDMKSILNDCKDYTLVNTYCVDLWGCKKMELYVLR